MTVGPIVTRKEIEQRAVRAARDTGAGQAVLNPYPALSDASAAFDAAYERALLAEMAEPSPKPRPKLAREQQTELRRIQSLRGMGAGLHSPMQSRAFAVAIEPAGSYLRTRAISRAAI